MTSEFIRVAEKVLSITRKPMRPREIYDYAHENKMFSDNISGQTPWQTLKSKLSVSVRRLGRQSPFVRTSPGKFFLRSQLASESEIYEAIPLRKPMPREEILVFEGKFLDKIGRFQGIRRNWKKYASQLFREERIKYLPRLDAESNEIYKQILTYVVVTRRGSVLSFKRGSYSVVADFLLGSRCIGFGGHVSASDYDLFTTHDFGVNWSATRELAEELEMPQKDRIRLAQGEGLKCIGVLNDDSSDVGQRHFAFLFRYEVSGDPAWKSPSRGEKSITQLAWLSRSSFPIPVWEFEYWSQLCLRYFFRNLIVTQPAYRILRRSVFSPPSILCIVGAVGSGKSEAISVLCNDYDFKEINSGRVVAKLLGIQPIPKTPREEFQSRAEKFIKKKQGKVRIAKALIDCVQDLGRERIVVDGIRHLETLESLRRLAKPRRVGVLFVHASPDIAYQFYREREQKDVTIFEFLRRRNARVEREVDKLLKASDAILYNWKGKADYKRAIKHMMRRLLH